MLQTNKEKEGMHNERVLQIENGSFSPILFAVTGTKGSRCNVVFSRIVELFLKKVHFEISSYWQQILYARSFRLLRTMLTCVQGSQSHKTSIKAAETGINITYMLLQSTIKLVNFLVV